MAETGIRSNTAMKTVAEDSKTVALATLRDSAAMRTIAAVTVFFLPATFTAVCNSSTFEYTEMLLQNADLKQTLFSTTFFNFQIPNSSVVSKWVWLYGLITVLLTVFTNVIWYSSTRAKDKEIKEKFENAEKNGDQVELVERKPPESTPKRSHSTGS